MPSHHFGRFPVLIFISISNDFYFFFSSARYSCSFGLLSAENCDREEMHIYEKKNETKTDQPTKQAKWFRSTEPIRKSMHVFVSFACNDFWFLFILTQCTMICHWNRSKREQNASYHKFMKCTISNKIQFSLRFFFFFALKYVCVSCCFIFFLYI